MRFSTSFLLSTRMHLIVQGMIFLFLPSMGELASVFIFASISISLNKMLRFPLWALILLIVKYMGLSSEILPIVSIDTCISSMRSITIRTPYCLKMEHIEVCIFLKFIQQIYRYLFFSVSKGTHISIVTAFNPFWVARTKFNLIFFRMVKLFYSIMRFCALIPKRAFILSTRCYILAYLTGIGP